MSGVEQSVRWYQTLPFSTSNSACRLDRSGSVIQTGPPTYFLVFAAPCVPIIHSLLGTPSPVTTSAHDLMSPIVELLFRQVSWTGASLSVAGKSIVYPVTPRLVMQMFKAVDRTCSTPYRSPPSAEASRSARSSTTLPYLSDVVT